MKKKNIYQPLTILMIILILVMILTHIIPSGRYTYQALDKDRNVIAIIPPEEIENYKGEGSLEPKGGSYRPVSPHYQNLWDVFRSPFKGFQDAIDIIFYLLILGGFIYTILATGSFDRVLLAVLHWMKGKELILIPILVFTSSLGGAIYGMEEEALAYYPLMIPFFIGAGLDSVIAPLILIGGGIIGGIWNSLVNPFAIGIASRFANLSIVEGMGFRFSLLLLFDLIISLYIVIYAKKIQKNPSLSLSFDQREVLKAKYLPHSDLPLSEHRMGAKDIWITVIFAFSFLIMVYSLLPLEGTILDTYHLGWSLAQLSGWFIVNSIIVAWISKLGEKQYIAAFLKGAKEFLSVGFVIALARGISLMLKEGRIADTLLYYMETALGGMAPWQFLLTVYLFLFPLVFFIPSSSGLATLVIPILAPVAHLTNTPVALLIMMYMAALGTVNPINPTNGSVIAGISFAGIDYVSWVKLILPLILTLALTFLLLIFLALSFGIGFH